LSDHHLKPFEAAGAIVCAILAVVGPASAARALPDTFVGRLEALALIETLNAELLSHASATETLTRWCWTNRLAPTAVIVARRMRGADKPADAQIRAQLGAASDEPIGYRRVALQCGDQVLSKADNWYRPSKLTAAMNEALETTDSPFGAVVRSLGFRRRTLVAELLFKPLGEDWRTAPRAPRGHGALAIPEDILRHRAVLETADGTPFSLVVETYTRGALAEPGRPTHRPLAAGAAPAP
jgi:chorismate-pyruvate lyase